MLNKVMRIKYNNQNKSLEITKINLKYKDSGYQNFNKKKNISIIKINHLNINQII